MHISIEGNIGAGKSYLIEAVRKFIKHTRIVAEPLEIWNNIKFKDGEDILTKFYGNMKRYGFLMQINCLGTKLRQIREANQINIVTERSFETDRRVFSEALMSDELMDPAEIEVYDNLKVAICEIGNILPTCYIYLRVDPEVCLERIKKRGRESEKTITLEYLQKIHKYHEEWLMDIPNVLIIDGNGPYVDDDKDYLQSIVTQITEFIKKFEIIKHEDSLDTGTEKEIEAEVRAHN